VTPFDLVSAPSKQPSAELKHLIATAKELLKKRKVTVLKMKEIAVEELNILKL